MSPTLEQHPCNQVWKPVEEPLARSAHLLNGSASPRTCPIASEPGGISLATE